MVLNSDVETIRVRDVMLGPDEYATISPNLSLRTAMGELSEHDFGLCGSRKHHRAVLVVDDSQHILGELTHWSILRSLEPHFLDDAVSSMERAGLGAELMRSVLEENDPFNGNLDQLCRAAGPTRVIDAMVPTEERIDEDAPLTRAIHRMVADRIQTILVVRDQDVVGVLRLCDLFKGVATRIRNDDT